MRRSEKRLLKYIERYKKRRQKEKQKKELSREELNAKILYHMNKSAEIFTEVRQELNTLQREVDEMCDEIEKRLKGGVK